MRLANSVRALAVALAGVMPVTKGALALGTWQGLYVAEHRARPHRREVVISLIGSLCAPA